jgi:hypothetical protein
LQFGQEGSVHRLQKVYELALAGEKHFVADDLEEGVKDGGGGAVDGQRVSEAAQKLHRVLQPVRVWVDVHLGDGRVQQHVRLQCSSNA